MADVMTTAEVMAALNVRKPDTIYALHKDGKIAGNQLRRQWRWSRLSVEAFIRGESSIKPNAVVPSRRAGRPASVRGAGPVPFRVTRRPAKS